MRLDESIPRWQIRDLKVSTSQLRYALRASEEQVQEAVELKPGQEMLIDLCNSEGRPPLLSMCWQ
jgi:hypothetical protein